ncbi:hypothetical protein KCU61_g26, partial [Aureobasidium melanogenum]
LTNSFLKGAEVEVWLKTSVGKVRSILPCVGIVCRSKLTIAFLNFWSCSFSPRILNAATSASSEISMTDPVLVPDICPLSETVSDQIESRRDRQHSNYLLNKIRVIISCSFVTRVCCFEGLEGIWRKLANFSGDHR